MKPLVSVITPSYNQARYLEDTIQSVLRQDYPALEYIIIDGESDDGSREIIQKYQSELAWWVSEADQGQADAINKGFRKANGEILAWLNSDDLYLPNTIQQAVQVFDQQPEIGVVYGNAVSANADGRLLNPLIFDDWGTEDFLQFKIICQPTVFMKRSFLEEVGYLDPSYHFFLDHQLWIRLSRVTEFSHQNKYWAVSRYHEEAKNVIMAAEAGSEVLKILSWAEKQEDLSDLMENLEQEIWAGAYQLIGRYLLDGGKPAQAFGSYLKAAISWLPSIRRYWARFLFSGLSVLGMGFLSKWYYKIKNSTPPKIIISDKDRDWPGLRLE